MNQLKPEVLSLVKLMSAKPVGFVAVIKRENIPSRLADSAPGEFLPISIRRYSSLIIEIVEGDPSDFVLEHYLRHLFRVQFRIDPVWTKHLPTWTYVHTHSYEVAPFLKKASRGSGGVSAVGTMQEVRLYAIFACLTRAKVAMQKGLAVQIYKILAAIEVVPEVARHEDPDFWLISNFRCLKLTKESDKEKVRQFARYLKELDQEQRAKEKKESNKKRLGRSV
jgi:hypothetical protein